VTPIKYHGAAESELLNEIAYFEQQVAGFVGRGRQCAIAFHPSKEYH